MKTVSEVSLKAYNTFGIDATAAQLAEVREIAQLQALLEHWRDADPFILGGGSNLLLPDRIERPVLLNRIGGKTIVEESADGYALVQCGAGEEWHAFVRWCIAQGLGGIENLSLIPGTVGAAPIQNIGAYGVELSDVFHSLQAVRIEDGALLTFDRPDCDFGYRDSIFKRDYKGRCCIVSVTFRLTARNHQLNTSYGAIQQVLDERGIERPSLAELSDAVIQIRQRKLPDPQVIGNSGSFFKNPIILREQYEALRVRFPDIVGYPVGEREVKLPAGWLIEQAGWKGKRLGPAGSYEKQALVLVNHGGARSKDIWALAERIVGDVEGQFGIRLEVEVNLVEG